MDRWERVFGDLVQARGVALTRYAYLLCGDPAEAADLVQEGLVKAFVRIGRGAGVDSAEAYVRRAILTTYLDGRRRHRRWYAVRHLLVTAEVATGVDGAVVDGGDVRAALAALSPRQRACVVLRYYEDLPVDAIADRLGVRPGTVKRHLSDALARLAGDARMADGGRVG